MFGMYLGVAHLGCWLGNHFD